MRRWVGALTVPRASRSADSFLPELHMAVAEINREMERTRRYHHPMAVIALYVVESKKELPRWQVIAVVGPTLRRHLRVSDVASFDSKSGCFVLVLPECEMTHAQTASTRVARLLAGEHALDVQAGIAVFPDNAFVFDDLVDVAIRRCGGSSQPVRPRGES